MPQALTDFRGRYHMRDPQKCPRLHENDPVLGVRVLRCAPAKGVITGTPETEDEDGKNRYLWVIDARGICYILEEPLEQLGHTPPPSTAT